MATDYYFTALLGSLTGKIPVVYLYTNAQNAVTPDKRASGKSAKIVF